MESPAFFVPAATDADQAETVYRQFAEWCKCEPLPIDRRIFSIRFGHNGTEWTATVGETLRGERVRRRRRRGEAVETREPLSDPATVLAIFEGDPFLVVTNATPIGKAPSYWANPFMAGVPKSVTRFSD